MSEKGEEGPLHHENGFDWTEPLEAHPHLPPPTTQMLESRSEPEVGVAGGRKHHSLGAVSKGPEEAVPAPPLFEHPFGPLEGASRSTPAQESGEKKWRVGVRRLITPQCSVCG